ncbi:MAG: glycosyltransferase family 2 protein [Lachnospiraceae bacterium]|nr:glycosyltransferase family 2 protein [Lachnospiraceae bacterium]
MNNTLYVVIPCYNEEEVVRETASRLLTKLTELQDKDMISSESKIMFVNDGSNDETWNIIKELHENNSVYTGISLSNNKGHQNALLAGLMTAMEKADMVISMDADLQDDVCVINEMVQKYHEGCDIVYGVRKNRSKDSFFKRVTANMFYKIMNWFGAKTVSNHADYRLMSKRTLEALAGYKEVNLFLRGLVPTLGFKTDVVYYERAERFAGESKYSFGKMMSFAVNGITGFSVKPIRMITWLGFLVFLGSIAILIYSFIRHFIGETIRGWTTLMVSIWAIGGLILLALGIVGEYVGKIYLETKGRPRYIIEENLEDIA